MWENKISCSVHNVGLKKLAFKPRSVEVERLTIQLLLIDLPTLFALFDHQYNHYTYILHVCGLIQYDTSKETSENSTHSAVLFPVT